MTRIDSNPNATYAREQMESTERAQEKQREENMRSERISESVGVRIGRSKSGQKR